MAVVEVRAQEFNIFQQTTVYSIKMCSNLTVCSKFRARVQCANVTQMHQISLIVDIISLYTLLKFKCQANKPNQRGIYKTMAKNNWMCDCELARAHNLVDETQ